jgi:4-hydroxybenzoate polyprenyltransferase
MAFYAAYLLSGRARPVAGPGRVHFLLGIAAGAAAGGLALHADPDRSRDGCFKAFRLNHWLGWRCSPAWR